MITTVRGKIALVLSTTSACFFPSVGGLTGDASSNDSALPDVNDGSDANVTDAPLDTKDSGPTPGPIAFVQINAQEFNQQGTALISLASVKAHDTLIVCAGLDGQGAVTLNDSQSDAFTQYVSFDSTTFGVQRNLVWAAFDVVGGNTTATLTTQVSHTVFEVYLIEYSGLTAFDVAASAQGNSTATDGMASGFATTTFGNDLIFGYGTEGIGVQGTSFTLRSGFESDVVEDRVVTTVGSYEATATMQSGPGWEISMVAFKGF